MIYCFCSCLQTGYLLLTCYSRGSIRIVTSITRSLFRLRLNLWWVNKMIDMILVLGECRYNYMETALLYRKRFPDCTWVMWWFKIMNFVLNEDIYTAQNIEKNVAETLLNVEVWMFSQRWIWIDFSMFLYFYIVNVSATLKQHWTNYIF